ncbi:MarR family transcriptional regulator [Deinococcus deserti]|uniref:Putative transcriptional regulator, MarR n=1 Tax=Deinococcus deserti (strain DSM 17065 / CIP 109153 / LMG 22923 / VCD115) TaxID=546414 RepID=C1CXA9_DEIDV|nr:MarR family transcriptional regulator [Deinococcus deserti]ACO46826.1 putative transcriptional regulator, MarR [Deinococcus deserti VCD115]
MLSLTPTELLAWRGFLHAHDTLWKALDAELTADELNLPAYELLTTLQEAGPDGLRMTELARRVRFSGGGLTRLADKLQAQGLIERRRCATDGRGWEAALTEQGVKKLRRVHVRHLRAVRARFLDRLTPAETELLAGLWPRFQEEDQ